MQNYRKLIVAGVGVGAMWISGRTGIPLDGAVGAVSDALIAVATCVAVWWFPNTKPLA